ncbi:MAG TPA: hypothetical protein VLR46_12535 [Candidatus Dormibacteraeota bacterium]|nr:hypothetical protein [Candidatus Dormibacteraeota bacterium]
MGIIQLPAGRLRGRVGERFALRQGIARGPGQLRVIKRLPAIDPRPGYCECCARPIDFGGVFHGARAYCSVECSLGGSHRPAG